MFQNTCTKCGQPFETKNPNRIVCPGCLYSGRGSEPGPPAQQYPPAYHQAPYPQPPQGQYGNRPQYPSGPQGQYGDRPQYPPRPQGQPGLYGERPQYPPGPQGQYGERPQYPPRPQGQYGDRPQYPPRPQGQPGQFGDRPQYPPRPPGQYGRPGGGFGGGRPGGFGGRPGGGGPRRAPKQLLIPKEILAALETQYVTYLPLPNPDVHEVLAQKLNIEPSKAFFGINLVRMKMKLPKLDYPKRKLAVSPDQLMAVEALYTPYMSMANPPIGVHKIISKQLKMDEWRVHVGIGLIRKSKNMARWNTERDDLPEQMKAHLATLPAEPIDKITTEADVLVDADVTVQPAKTRAAKKAPVTAVVETELSDASSDNEAKDPSTPDSLTVDAVSAPKKRGRPKKLQSDDIS